MLTMVQHQQHPSIIDDTDERVDRRQTRLDRQAQGIQHRDGHAVSVSDRSQVAIPTAISEFVCNLGADLQRETGFPHPIRTGKRHQSFVGQEPPHVVQLSLATDKARQVAASGMLDGDDLWHHDRPESIV
ncbi:Uncharacterised protein [Mycobacterium tuberculosis]|nr:Uncharacterised protein [Mycobacterium tuberculosis]